MLDERKLDHCPTKYARTHEDFVPYYKVSEFSFRKGRTGIVEMNGEIDELNKLADRIGGRRPLRN